MDNRNSCRFCGQVLNHVFADLGEQPPSNSFLTKEQLTLPEEKFPLKVFVCDHCFLVQVGEVKKATEIFNESYAYFSSYSSTWVEHCRNYAEMIVDRLRLDASNRVIEIASNDGYLLQFFLQKKIPVLGIEPTANTAAAAIEKGIDTKINYFTTVLAKELAASAISADLLIGNNVLAHVPDINDFVNAMKIMLAKEGTITMEFPHLLQLVQQNQFDTIYHEHFSYFSFHTVKKIFVAHDLTIFDVEEVPTHGGSLRIYARHAAAETLIHSRVHALLQKEEDAGMMSLSFYLSFQQQIDKVKTNFIKFLRKAKQANKKVAAHGAAAKANTLLNYCKLKEDLISFVSDNSPHKQGKYLPGSHIPVVHPDRHLELKPDYIIIFPWNIREEIMQQFDFARRWHAEFVTAIPQLHVS